MRIAGAGLETGAAKRLRRATLAKLLKQCRIRRLTAEDLHALFHQPALVVAPGVTEGAVEAIEMLVEQLQVVNRQVKTMDRRIEELLAELPAVLEEAGDREAERPDALAQLRSMDGAGPIVAAGLFGEASDLLIGGQLRAGPGLPGGRSGDQTVRGERQGEPTAGGEPPWTKRLYHFATAAIAADKGVQQQKEELKARGLKHARILRTIGDRRLRVFFAMRRDGTLYGRNSSCSSFVQPSSPRPWASSASITQRRIARGLASYSWATSSALRPARTNATTRFRYSAALSASDVCHFRPPLRPWHCEWSDVPGQLHSSQFSPVGPAPPAEGGREARC